jgi:hypothetical protein
MPSSGRTRVRIPWRGNTEDEGQGDITLEVVAEQGCLSPIEKWTLDERFGGDGAKLVEDTWGKWD